MFSWPKKRTSKPSWRRNSTEGLSRKLQSNGVPLGASWKRVFARSCGSR